MVIDESLRGVIVVARKLDETAKQVIDMFPGVRITGVWKDQALPDQNFCIFGDADREFERSEFEQGATNALFEAHLVFAGESYSLSWLSGNLEIVSENGDTFVIKQERQGSLVRGSVFRRVYDQAQVVAAEHYVAEQQHGTLSV